MPFTPYSSSTTKGFVSYNEGGFPKQEPPEVKKTLLEKLANNPIANMADKWGASMQRGGQYAIDEARSAASDIGSSLVKGDVLGGIKRVGQTGLRQAGNVAGVALNPLQSMAEPITKPILKAAGNLPAAGGGTLGEAGSQVLNAYQIWQQKHPEAAKDLEAGINISSLLGTNVAFEKAGISPSNMTKPSEIIPQTAETFKDVYQSGKQSIKNSLESKYVNQAMKEWSTPTTKPGYTKAAEIYNKAKSKGHDISDTLVKNKIDTSQVVQDGKFMTTETAHNIRVDAGKLSKDLLRPSLEAANPSVESVSPSELLRAAKANIARNTGLTREMKNTLLAKLDDTSEALSQQYPDGLRLTDLLDEKIVRDLNSNYSPIGDIATNMEAIKNKAIADASRKFLINNSPSDLPVGAFEKELSKQFQAADYLDALNGKKAPVSIGSKIAKTSAKVAGAATGHGLGGGIIGGVGGYHVGGMIESWIESLPNPIKQAFLKNMEISNPEAFNAVQKYLTLASEDQTARLALPSPSSIELGPKTPSESYVKGLPAQKQVYRSPSGQMQRGYTSEPITNTAISNAAEAGIKTQDTISETIRIMNKIKSGDLIVPKGMSIREFILKQLKNQ